MSSHHVVRDEQEPALIVVDFTFPQMEDIGQLLEWSPTVIGLEESLNDLITAGIKVDVAVISPENLIEWQENLAYQQPVKVLTTNDSLVQRIAQVINHLLAGKYKTFHILSNRLTVFDFINLYQNFRLKAELIYISQSQKITVHHVGKFRKWLAEGESISVFPMEEPTYLRTTGFLENKDNEIITTEEFFKTVEEGVVSIETNLKPVMVAESL